MKRYFVLLLLAVLSLSLLSGCGLLGFMMKMDSAENAAEQKLDEMERAAEAAARDVLYGDPFAEAALTGEDALNIALEHAGFAEDEVQGLRAEGEIDDGVPQYDVTFRVDRLEYEYEIHAETGEILSFERDD